MALRLASAGLLTNHRYRSYRRWSRSTVAGGTYVAPAETMDSAVDGNLVAAPA